MTRELLDVEIDLPYLKPPLSLNQRMHWAPKRERVAQLRSDAIRLALYHRLPKGLDRVHIALHWQPTIRRNRDVDNPTPTLKALVDGLTAYGLTVDDDSEHVTSGCVIDPVAPTARLWLRIVESTAPVAAAVALPQPHQEQR